MKTLAYVYKWTQLSTGKWYIGSRTAKGCNPSDGYICSSKMVKPMILENSTDWVPQSPEHKEKLSNSKKGRVAWNKGMKMSDEFRLKVSIAHLGQGKGRSLSEETKKKISDTEKATKSFQNLKTQGSVVPKLGEIHDY